MVRKKARRKPRQEEDPMAGTTNLTDAMLVLALGFLIFAVVGWNLQSVVFSDMTQEEKQNVMQQMSEVSEVDQGQQLNETPDVSNKSGQGYTEMGKVYQDSSGKLIMVEGK
jgi:hypothetical protein